MTDQPLTETHRTTLWKLYSWRIGDVFTDGTHRWAVDSIYGEKAIMRSCGSSWATTIPLSLSEWREGGRWRLEEREPQ